mmetsp:Transcript_69945/g.124041  ORF Transcript_69945/g.124041 Transcript_69945/m.124041 type:complete len:216 (+) Transcript_69945:254-901(+)
MPSCSASTAAETEGTASLSITFTLPRSTSLRPTLAVWETSHVPFSSGAFAIVRRSCVFLVGISGSLALAGHPNLYQGPRAAASPAGISSTPAAVASLLSTMRSCSTSSSLISARPRPRSISSTCWRPWRTFSSVGLFPAAFDASFFCSSSRPVFAALTHSALARSRSSCPVSCVNTELSFESSASRCRESHCRHLLICDFAMPTLSSKEATLARN